MEMVKLSGLVKSFGSVRALDGLDLSAASGTVCALLGPNGAGKTTAIRVLATLTLPDAGDAFVAGYNVLTHPRQVREHIGMAGQHAAVDDDLTGRENLVILGRMYHLGRRAAGERAAELLDQFDLSEAADRLVKTWSGGMRRRLDLVASLVVSPSVLFLDEPTTGLDPRSRNEVWCSVSALAASGTTILLTTQYLEEADRLADQVVIIDNGHVVAQGTPEALKGSLGTRIDVVVERIENIDAAAAVMAQWATSPPEIDGDERRVSTQIVSSTLTLPEVVRQLEIANIDAEDVTFRRPTLDEVFLNRTGNKGAETTP
jgi:ABC-2 type transport system ATP-binding protein